ncbi:MAG: hypothetical protein AB4041_00475 [Microcystaceae cyanobacterium]
MSSNLSWNGKMAKNWAIFIVINQYKPIKTLNCLVNDADKMYQWFKV